MIELGRYLLEERLGSGALTEAYRAKSFGVEGFEKTLCVKRLLPNRAEMKKLAQSFIDLAQSSLSLSHANVAQVIDLGRASASIPGEGSREQVFVATEIVHGLDLGSLASRAADDELEVPLGVALLVGAEVAKALGHAHRRRSGTVLHGALTPRSIIVSWEGEVKVTDFAIGRTLAMAHFAPDPDRVLPYLAPEALQPDGAVPASDLFALGVVLFELITGKRPATRGDGSKSGGGTKASELRAGVPASVDALFDRLLAEDPSKRIDDAGSLHEELLGEAYGLGSSASPVDLAELVSRLGRRASSPRGLEADTALLIAATTPSPGSVGAARAEKREATLFVIDGLDTLGAGDDTQRKELREKVERAGGLFVSSDASELRAVFGLVEADGRDAHAAALVGLSISRAYPDCGVGVDIARVTADEAGALVNDAELGPAFASAAKLAAGGRGSVCLSRAAARIVGAELELTGDGAHARVVGTRTSALPLVRFVARKRELEALGRAFSAAATGSPRLTVITGDGGMGKSRLLTELGQRIAKIPTGVEVVRASCPRDLSGSPAPLAAIAEVVRAMVGLSGTPGHGRRALAHGAGKERDESVRKLRALGLDETDVEELTLLGLGGSGSGGRERSDEPRAALAFERAILRLARDRPLFVALDDAQYVDRESAAILEKLIRTPEARLFIVLAARERPVVLGEAGETLVLTPLAVDEVALLAAGILGARVLPPELVRYVEERAQGAPLAVELVLKELTEAALVSVKQGAAEVDLERATVPRGLRALVEGKLAKLGAGGDALSSRDVFRTFAILGADASLDEVAAMIEAPVEQVRAALARPEAASLLESGLAGPRLKPSMAEVIADTLPAEERQRAHARAAALLAAEEPTAERLDRIGSHLQQAGEASLAAQRFAAAALLHTQPSHAARSAARALGAAPLDELSAETLRQWLGTLARAALRSHARVRIGELAPAILDRIDACGDPSDRVSARLDLARLSALDSSFEEAHVALEGARSLSSTPELETLVFATEVEIAEQSGEVDRARSAALRLVELGSSLDPRLLLDVASVLGQTLELEAATRALDAAFDGAIAGSAMLRASVEVRRAELLLGAGDPASAHRSALLAADLAEAHGLTYDVARAKIALATAYHALGRKERAYAAFVEATEAAESGSHERLRIIARGGVSLFEGKLLDKPRGALVVAALERSAREAEARGFLIDAIRLRLFWAELLAVHEGPTEARIVIETARQGATTIGHPALLREVDQRLALLG